MRYVQHHRFVFYLLMLRLWITKIENMFSYPTINTCTHTQSWQIWKKKKLKIPPNCRLPASALPSRFLCNIPCSWQKKQKLVEKPHSHHQGFLQYISSKVYVRLKSLSFVIFINILVKLLFIDFLVGKWHSTQQVQNSSIKSCNKDCY